jgi:drug/metabolite transporter (DMT)-like permease
MWLFLSLGTAMCAGTSDALAKKAVATERVGLVSWVRSAWGSLFLVPLMLLASRPSDPAVFWRSVACAVPLEVAAAYAFQTALSLSPISSCIPFLAFTPVFLLITGWTFLGERPTPLGVVGVVLVAVGAFALYRRRETGPGSQRGPLLILLVAFLYSITNIFAKKALTAPSPLFFCGAYYASVALGQIPLQWRASTWARDLIRRPRLFVSIGVLEASSFLFQFHAYMVGKVAYTLALKRLSLLLSLFYGRFVFKERDLRARALGAALMVAGAVLVALRS